jgi:hypothetical protein
MTTLNPAFAVAALKARTGGQEATEAFLAMLSDDIRSAVEELYVAADEQERVEKRAAAVLGLEKQMDPRADTEAIYDALFVVAEQIATYKPHAKNATGWEGYEGIRSVVTPFGSISVTLTTQKSAKK